MTNYLFHLILFYSNLYQIDTKVVTSVIEHESHFNIHARGQLGEVGLMQLLPSSFPNYSLKQLEDPNNNLKLGIGYLSKMKKQCKFKNGIEWIVCYNLGPYKASKVKYPKLFPYYKKVNGIYKMKQFKEGEKVIIKNLYNLSSDGVGIYLGVSNEHHYKGYYKIQNENGHVMHIEPERIEKEKNNE